MVDRESPPVKLLRSSEKRCGAYYLIGIEGIDRCAKLL
jgi:hypothetical protein